MKTLYLARHAKSSWDVPGISDFDRPLLEKGIMRTKKAVRYLNEIQAKIDKIVASPAVRTFETAKLIAEGIEFPVEDIITDKKIYEGSVQSIMEIIFSTEDEFDSLMIFGHNPTITYLANQFLHPGIDFMPTIGIACVSFETDKWTELPLAKSKNEFVLFPKTLAD